MDEEKTEGRVRMNVNLTAKGTAQWDVTAEYSDPEQSKQFLKEAIRKCREVIAEEGLKEVPLVEKEAKT
jgi:translation initiation factor 2 alpha subunit (eIF-2alpha)